MSGNAPRPGALRPAPMPSAGPRGRPGLRVATDTILAPRPLAKPAAAPTPRAQSVIFAAALMVATTALAAALIRHMAIGQLGVAETFRFAGIVMPILAGIVALLILSGRAIARSRALATLAIAAAFCPIMLAFAGPGFVGLMTMISGAIAFVALALALDWAASAGKPRATGAALVFAAALIGTMSGDALAPSYGPPPPGLAAALIVLVGPVALVAGYRRPEVDGVPSLAATQAILTNYALLGLLAAAAAAAVASQLLGVAMPFVALGNEASGFTRGVMMAGTLIALLAGGFLADRVAKDERGYAVWFAATLALAGAAALLSKRLGLVEAGHAILLARLLPFAGIGAALALITRLAPPAARLGALIAFFAARAIGLAVVAPMIARRESSLEYDAMAYGAFILLLAAAAVYATMPRRSR